MIIVLYYDAGTNRIEHHEYPNRHHAYIAGKEFLDAGASTVKILEVRGDLVLGELIRIPADLKRRLEVY